MSKNCSRASRATMSFVHHGQRLSLLAICTGLILTAACGTGSAAGDAARGKTIYESCMACHSLDKNAVGPMHHGVFGRKAGTVAGYDYSLALKKAGLVWDGGTLDKWLIDPQALVPGTKMIFKLPDANERADVIEFLRVNSAK